MGTAPLSDLVVPLALLAMGLGLLCGAALTLAVFANSLARRSLRQAREAVTRAALAESALADLRHRRSAAVAKGNRTRASVQAEKQRAMTDDLRHAVAVAKTPPQGALPLDMAATIAPDAVPAGAQPLQGWSEGHADYLSVDQ